MSDNKTPEQLEAEIAAQRAQLADTVEKLSAKLDVKSQARAKVADVKEQGRATVADVKDRATTAEGKPRPEVLAAAGSLLAMTIAYLWWRRTR